MRSWTTLFLATAALCLVVGAGARADEAEMLRRIEQQQRTIDAQNERIDRLERLLQGVLNDRGTGGGVASPVEAAPSPAAAASSPPAPLPPQKTAQESEAAQQPAEQNIEDPLSGGPAAKGYDPERAFSGPLPRWRSKDGAYSLAVGGLMQYDLAFYDQDSQGGDETTQALAPDLSNGSRVRRAILGMNGLILGDWIYAFSYDMADTDAGVVDGLRAALLVYRGLDPWWIILGQQANRIGLDTSTFSSRRTFLEAALPTATFAFSPGTPTMGVSILNRGPKHALRLGLFGEPASTEGNSDEGWGVHGRAVWAPIAERTRTLHFGTSAYWRQPDTIRGDGNLGTTTTSTIRFSNTPEVSVDRTLLLDTGMIPRVDDYYHVGLEAGLVWGPWSVQGEYGYTGLNRKNGPNEPAFQNLDFDGYYVQGSYFLTGESRNFFPRFGSYWRIKPHNDFSPSKGGVGAWEVAARYSYLDLDDGADNLAAGGIRGGIGENYTLGLNWYPNAFVRVLLNYIHSDIDNLSDGGLSEGDVFDVLALRMQVEW